MLVHAGFSHRSTTPKASSNSATSRRSKLPMIHRHSARRYRARGPGREGVWDSWHWIRLAYLARPGSKLSKNPSSCRSVSTRASMPASLSALRRRRFGIRRPLEAQSAIRNVLCRHPVLCGFETVERQPRSQLVNPTGRRRIRAPSASLPGRCRTPAFSRCSMEKVARSLRCGNRLVHVR